MTTDTVTPPASTAVNMPESVPANATAIAPVNVQRRWLQFITAVAIAAAMGCVLLWQKVSGMQEQLARQSADTSLQATEARANARQAQELALETAAKQSVMDAKVNEVTLQRSQLEELIRSLSRSRDENLVVDIESAVRLAQQQAQLTGSVEPLLAALKSADLRVSRAAQPRLTPVQRAIARDIAKIKGTAIADTPSLLVKLDELVSLVDELPMGNSVRANAKTPSQPKTEEAITSWWVRMGSAFRDEARNLVRLSRIEDPDAALLSPEQSFFLRENLKLRLLNARLGLLSRQAESARADLVTAASAMTRFFDPSSRRTQTAVALMAQVQSQMKSLELPRVDDTLAALATAAAGR